METPKLIVKSSAPRVEVCMRASMKLRHVARLKKYLSALYVKNSSGTKRMPWAILKSRTAVMRI